MPSPAFRLLQNPPPITIGGNNTQSPYQLTLQDADQNEIYRWAPTYGQDRTLPGFMNVTSDLQIASPQINVDIDRDRAADVRRYARSDSERAFHRLWDPAGLDDLHARRTNTR